MASLHSVEAAILAQINAATAGLFYNNIEIQVLAAIGWPPEKLLQNNVRGTTSVISVYDRKLSKNSTRWKPIVLSSTVIPSTLTNALLHSTVAPSGTTTITLGGSVTAGDAVSVVLTNNSLGFTPEGLEQNQAAQVVIGTASSTPTTIAAALASVITADPVMSLWVTASATGSVLTLTSKLSRGTLVVQSNVGNGGTNTREIGRRERAFQVIVWSPTSDIRSLLVNAIETVIQQLELNFGLTFSDGTGGRLYYQNDFDLEDATLADTYRHDFLFCVDYPITEQDALFSVLAPIQAYQIE